MTVSVCNREDMLSKPDRNNYVPLTANTDDNCSEVLVSVP